MMRTEERIVLNMLRRACEAEQPTPTSNELWAELKRWGRKVHLHRVPDILDSLVAAGHAATNGKTRRDRVYTINGKTTLPRRILTPRAEPAPAAPKPNAYDLNMRLGPPIRIKGRPDSERPMPRFVAHASSPVNSEVGCSAEMCAL